ncbi:toxin TcdB middle/C-terminal domain-containing protein [Candidatus Regiella insecticola]|uniref:toxin TcdB middle/C-terminal domain-containing protein n=1 Tax=Candidatus Regiella insecticola TaxID=138073 RepID=UPI0015970FC8|nr:toxin TcdB middle/C-terminal domain-containing protein [Candidatus Regiella insecticola]
MIFYNTIENAIGLLSNSFNKDHLIETPTEQEHYWLHRALKGRLLRTEVYGLDDSDQAHLPYTVSNFRYQVRRIQHVTLDVALPSLIEQCDYRYERIPSDPQCQQQIQLQLDVWGYPLRSLVVYYPRRTVDADNAPSFLSTLSHIPGSSWASSDDEQQKILRIHCTRQSWHHLVTNDIWRLGLPHQQRNEIWHYAAAQQPKEGLSLEQEPLEKRFNTTIFVGQQQKFYTAGNGEIPLITPTVQGLVAFTETAVFNDETLSKLLKKLPDKQLEEKLTAAGYRQTAYLFASSHLPVDNRKKVWMARQGYTDYADAQGFYRPLAQRATSMIGKTQLVWDKHYCVIKKTLDSAGHVAEADYDYRFLIPFQLTDCNNNIERITLDALGRTQVRSWWGTEQGERVGFPASSTATFTPPQSVTAALTLQAPLPVAQLTIFAPGSWMQRLEKSAVEALNDDPTLWQTLRAHRFITEDGFVYALARKRWGNHPRLSVLIAALLADNERLPPHHTSITADRYFNKRVA